MIKYNELFFQLDLLIKGNNYIILTIWKTINIKNQKLCFKNLGLNRIRLYFTVQKLKTKKNVIYKQKILQDNGQICSVYF